MSEARQRIGRGIWRSVYASLVDHPDYPALSPQARLVFFVLRLGTSNTIASIFPYYRDALRAQTGLTSRALEAALRELARTPRAAPWIIRDQTVCWIRNGLQHDPTFSLENENHVQALRRTVAALPQRSSVVRRFLQHYPQLQSGVSQHPMGDGMGGRDGGMASPMAGGDKDATPTPNPIRRRNYSETARARANPTPRGTAPPPPPSVASAVSDSKRPTAPATPAPP